MSQAPKACASGCHHNDVDLGAELALLKAMADPVRLQILLAVSRADGDSLCACSMTEAFGVSQPTLSHHLKKLVEAGLLSKEMRGTWAHFSLQPGALEPLRTLTETLAAAEPACAYRTDRGRS